MKCSNKKWSDLAFGEPIGEWFESCTPPEMIMALWFKDWSKITKSIRKQFIHDKDLRSILECCAQFYAAVVLRRLKELGDILFGTREERGVKQENVEKKLISLEVVKSFEKASKFENTGKVFRRFTLILPRKALEEDVVPIQLEDELFTFGYTAGNFIPVLVEQYPKTANEHWNEMHWYLSKRYYTIVHSVAHAVNVRVCYVNDAEWSSTATRSASHCIGKRHSIQFVSRQNH